MTVGQAVGNHCKSRRREFARRLLVLPIRYDAVGDSGCNDYDAHNHECGL